MGRRLREPQKLAMPYVATESSPALFLEMRLGKTLVVIRRVIRYVPMDSKLRILIVAPNSALGSWEDELQEENQTDYVFLQGTRTDRLILLQQDHTWNLINKEGWISLPEISETMWDVVVLDESTFIKNPQAKVTKFFLRYFNRVPHKWILTGKPNPQNDLEYWCQMAFIDTRPFGCGSYWDFRATYFERSHYGFNWVPKIGAMTKIKKYLVSRVFALRRKDVGMDVKKIFEKRYLYLNAKMKKIYRTLKKEFLIEVDGTITKQTKYSPVRYSWMRELCNGFVDDSPTPVWDGKFQELEYFLQGELIDEPVVVWFNFNRALRYAVKRLKALDISCESYLGSTPVKKRRKIVKEFRKGKFRVLCIQVATAETGLNLSISDTSIYFSPPVSVQKYEQTQDRILDVDDKTPLLILHLLVKNSIEIHILKLLRQKSFSSSQLLKRLHELMVKDV